MDSKFSKSPGASLLPLPCGTCPSAAEIIGELLERKDLIQDFRPLEESLDWRLGQTFYQHRGSHAFLSGDVPYTINNDGYLSQQAAELLFTSLAASEADTPSGQPIHVIEFGAGIGIFARLFLDCFRDLCQTHKKDYYSRLCYHVTDGSARMVEDWTRADLFGPHRPRCRLAVADAMLPQLAVPLEEIGAGVRAIFANYILDSLPATVLRFSGSAVERLYVRARLSRRVRLNDFVNLSLDEVIEAAESRPDTLVDLYPLFSLDYSFRPSRDDEIPFLARARELASPENPCVVHSHGAVRSLERMLRLLAPGGFILINDYANTGSFPVPNGGASSTPYQRFGGSTAAGLNLELLKRCCTDLEDAIWVEPKEDNEHLHSRLLLRGPDPTTAQQFSVRFAKKLFDWTHQPVETARELGRQGRPEGALAAYREALQRQPKSWLLLNEVAQYLLSSNEPEAARQFAESALRLNPLAPESWNLLGDAYWALGKWEEAHQAFLEALNVFPGDVRGRHNLVYTLSRKGDFASALQLIAEGLLLDVTGAFRDRLLERQAEILSRLSRRAEIQSRILSDRSFSLQDGRV
ncbi:MAG: SAM-dependent methyltransferase [Bryobacteraceae bacterium]